MTEPISAITPGRYRATPIAWGLREASKSHAMAVSIDWIPTERQVEPDVWLPTGNNGAVRVTGDLWIIKADGTVNNRQVDTLANVLGWSGDLEELKEDSGWKPPQAEIDVEEEEYPVGSGKIKLKVAWVNPIGGGPRGAMRASKSRLAEIAAEQGDRFKRVIQGEADPFAGPTPPTGDDLPF